MASDIVITPNRGSTSVNAKIDFTGASTASSQIRLEVLPDNSLAFAGTAGSLFSIADSVTGSLMSVNDSSGLPILEVFDTDKVVMGQYNQNTLVVNGTQVGIGTATPSNRLTIAGVSNNGITLTGVNATITAAGATPNLLLSAGSNVYLRPATGFSAVIDTGNGLFVGGSGAVLIGTSTNSANGKLQLTDHTTSAGGIGFGTDVSLHRYQAGGLSINATNNIPALILRQSGANAMYLYTSALVGYVGTSGAYSLNLQTNGTTALTLDSSQNATFAGRITVGSGTSAFNIGNAGQLTVASNGAASDTPIQVSNTAQNWQIRLNGANGALWMYNVTGATIPLILGSDSNATFAQAMTARSTFTFQSTAATEAIATIRTAPNSPGSRASPLYSSLNFRGYDGASGAGVLKGAIRMGDMSSNTGASILSFWNMDQSSVHAERARFDEFGNLLIGGTTNSTGTGGLKVFGTTASTSTTTGALQVAGGVGVAGAMFVGGAVTITGTLTSTVAEGNALTDKAVGYRNIPQNSKSAAYTLVAADAGKHIYHPSADTTARTWTIPYEVDFPIGTAITFVNDTSAGSITITISGFDTLVLAGPGTTGSRTLAANGVATAIKIAANRWMISGTNLT